MRFTFVLGLVALLGACNTGGTDTGTTPAPEDTSGPYVSVAVDNHFHDIHPEDHKRIAADRAFEVRNEGRNLHNVTIAGTDISRDVRPGRSFILDPVGESLDPGKYQIICKYHDSVGMNGEITVVE